MCFGRLKKRLEDTSSELNTKTSSEDNRDGQVSKLSMKSGNKVSPSKAAASIRFSLCLIDCFASHPGQQKGSICSITRKNTKQKQNKNYLPYINISQNKVTSFKFGNPAKLYFHFLKKEFVNEKQHSG